MAPLINTVQYLVRHRFEKAVRRVLSKTPIGFGYGPSPHIPDPNPPYERNFHPQWIYRIRQNNSLINNAIEEKVNQVFRRGLGDWEEAYVAKCPHCREEFDSEEPFRDQLGEDGDLPEEVDFTVPRPCPNEECPSCDEQEGSDGLVEFETPDEDVKDWADEWLQQVNSRNVEDHHLEPKDFNSIGQDAVGVLREVSWDVESFDDAWILFEREYLTDPEGRIIDWDLKGVHRAPPEVMRYVVDPSTGDFGGKYWICVECRATDPDYRPETRDDAMKAHGAPRCSKCGNHTYEAYAVAKGEREYKEEDDRYYIRGEFYHDSLYAPSRFYGFSPIMTLWEEARTLEQMDKWYHDAYEERRAPKGAIIVSSTNDESTRAWNKGEMEKLRNDPNHIPLFINDIEEGKQDPLKFVELLASPADMQHMEMREWFMERISAKYGVTEVLMSGSPEASGLSQSMEVQVANRSAERLRRVMNDALHAILRQLKVDGWNLEIAEVEEEDEAQEAQLIQSELANARAALEVGLEVEWTDDNRAVIRPGDAELEQDGMGMDFGFPGAEDPEGPPIPEEDDFPGNDGEGGEPEAPPRPPEPPQPEEAEA